jgi:hypothetical protein
VAYGFVDSVLFVPTAGGLTDWTVSAAVGGFFRPQDAGAVNGTIYRYRAQSSDLTQWEFGEGAWTTATTILARTTIRQSSNSNAKVNFSAAPQVGLVLAGEDVLDIANTQTANTVFAGPGSGAAAAPTFRALVSADIVLLAIPPLFFRSATGSTDTTAAGDQATLITYSGTTTCAVSLTTSGIATGWWAVFKNENSGLVTFTPASGNIDGSANQTLEPSCVSWLTFNGTNFRSLHVTDGGTF